MGRAEPVAENANNGNSPLSENSMEFEQPLEVCEGFTYLLNVLVDLHIF